MSDGKPEATVVSSSKRRYIPIVKAKRGEAWVIGNRTALASTNSVPLVETHEVPANIGNLLANPLAGRPVFIDTELLGIQEPSKAPEIFQSIAQRDIVAIPVTGLFRSQIVQQAIKSSPAAKSNGIMLRLKPSAFAPGVPLALAANNLLEFLEVAPANVDVLIDLGETPPAGQMALMLQLMLTALPQPNAWRSVTVSAGSFPKSTANTVVG